MQDLKIKMFVVEDCVMIMQWMSESILLFEVSNNLIQSCSCYFDRECIYNNLLTVPLKTLHWFPPAAQQTIRCIQSMAIQEVKYLQELWLWVHSLP